MADDIRNHDRTRIAEGISGLSGDEIPREREHVIAAATRELGESARIEIARSPKSYAGRVLATTDHHVIQEHGGHSGVAVVHDSRAQSGRGDLTGKEVEISYPHGRAGLVRQDLSSFDRELIAREREARDGRDKIVDRESRPGDDLRLRRFEARSEAFADARFKSGKASLEADKASELARYERQLRTESAYAFRQGDPVNRDYLSAKADSFIEAREVLEKSRNRDGPEASARQSDRAGREGREAPVQQGPELGDR